MTIAADLTITGTGAALAAGATTAVELATSLLDRIESVDGRIGSFITVRPAQEILEEAAASDERRRSGAVKGPLDGIPIAHKDNIATAGIRTTAGSLALSEWIPDEDATVVRRLANAGTVLLGKLKSYEFAHSGVDNLHFGRTRNPLDEDRVTGGSSSGSAAALAAGLCLGATGTDTGGSIRIPASFTGVVGLKPTAGLISRHGVVTTSWSLDTVGPMARTTADTALLLAVMEGHDPRDRVSIQRARSAPFTPRIDLAGVRVGVERRYFTTDLDADVNRVFTSTLGTMTALGAEVVEVAIPNAADGIAAEKAIVYPEAAAAHEDRLADRFSDYGPRLVRSLLSGYYFRAVDYVRAQQVRESLLADVEAAFLHVDVIATPTTPLAAPLYTDTAADAAGASELLHRYIRFLVLANLTGHPGVSVPCGTADTGMPIGLQLIGKAFDDGFVLSVAHALEAHLNGASSAAQAL